MGGIGPLSLLSILEYALVYDIEGEQLEDFLWFLQRIDAAYLRWVGDKNGHRPAGIQQKDDSAS